MPKRKRDDKKRRITEKIRRLEKRLHRIYEYSSDSSMDEDHNESDHQSPYHNITSSIESDTEILPLSDSDNSVADNNRPRSVVISAQVPPNNTEPIPSATAPPEPAPVPSTSAHPTLPPDILEALGDPKTKEEIFGPPIPDEIAERWGRVLVDGLTKEQKQKIEEKYLIPNNFLLAKAPSLNPEITHVLSDAARIRDKLMEKSQNQLGRGISELTYLATSVIKEDLSKVEMLKKIAEISQIFLDLHYEDTKRRRKLITSSLDKKFLYMVTEVKRDAFLFGANLGEKIKASKTAERSGLQIRRNDTAATPSTSRKSSQSGNWRGPPRTQGQRTNRQGGSKGRYSSQQNRRPPPPADRAPRTTKTNPKAPKY